VDAYFDGLWPVRWIFQRGPAVELADLPAAVVRDADDHDTKE
jgi:hypothetical protein